MNENEQKEIQTIAHLISALANLCETPPNYIVDLFVGDISDEEYAGTVKERVKKINNID